MARDPDLCVVTCALTGVLADRKHCPSLPYTPVEIGEEARRAYDAGASVVHIHARNDDGSPTFSPEVFEQIRREVRARSPVLLNFSTGTLAEDVSQQCEYIAKCRPEIAALNMGTMNYSKYSRQKKAFAFDMVFPNTYEKISKLLRCDERRPREAGAGVLRHRSHARHLAAARHGRAEAAAAVLVHRQRAGRATAARRSAAAPGQGDAPRIGVGGHRHLAAGVEDDRVGAGARRQRALRPGRQLLSPRRLDGLVERRAVRCDRQNGSRRRAQGGLGRRDARDLGALVMNMRDLVRDLEARREAIRAMGGQERVDKQHARGKLTARERFAIFFDDGLYFEVGMHGTQMGMFAGEDGKDKPPADAVICAFGKVDGRMVCSAAYDFTVKGGSIGYTGEEKVTRLRHMALSARCPMVWFIDSGGARIDAGYQPPRRDLSLRGQRASVSRAGGHVRRGAAGRGDGGPGRGGHRVHPGPRRLRADGEGHRLDGARRPRAGQGGDRARGQRAGARRLQGSQRGERRRRRRVCRRRECIAAVKKYLSYFPSHCDEDPPIRASSDPIDRRDEALLDLLPESKRKAYDMYKLISSIVDDGDFLDIKPRFARNVITCLARFGGRPVGIVANQPNWLGGILDIDSADKAAHFIQICDAFNVPLVFLQDVPGFMVGSKVEAQGIIRHGAKMLHVMSAATVPKITVVVRKAYGAGYYVMCGRAFEPDLIVAWPSAEIA